LIKINIKKQLHGASGDMNLDVDLQIKSNDFIALIGQSGSGKTTMLRVLAGLEKSDGLIKVDSTIWQDNKTFLTPQKRKIGFVFQDYALFPNLSVEENLLYVNKDITLAKELLELTELSELKNRMPNTLSGGQKQRVSLCRAMMNRPKLLLMDEPLSALDPNMRLKLQHEILLLHKKFETTTIMVSHDLSEIYKLSNQLIELQNGKVIKYGDTKKLLLDSTNSQKFSFQGEIIDIKKVDVINIAVISIGQQLVEVVLSSQEVQNLTIGQNITVGTKAFTPIVSV
jgi:molybdate transport system ATP-binding protein